MNILPEKNGKRTVTIFGGGGYIGPVIAQRLLNNGYKVRIIDLFLYESQNVMLGLLAHPDFEVVAGDYADPKILKQGISGATDIIILAGLVGDPITKKYPEAHKAINQLGMSNLINSLNGHSLSRVIFVSTCSNYGLIEKNELADENYELSPLSLYATAKVEAEKQILRLKGKTDFDATILRFATAFGLAPRMRFDLTVSQFIQEMFLKRELVVYDPDTWRPYCHVQDFASAIQNVLEAPSKMISFEVFNAGGQDNNYTKRMLVELISKYIPNPPITYQEFGSDPRNYRVNFDKITSKLNFFPCFSVEDGIKELIAALEQDLFSDQDFRPNFYGNYAITFPPEKNE